MARRAGLLYLDQKRVAVAVECNVLDRLSVAAGLTFHPELLPGPAPEMGPARDNRLFQRSAVHPGHHEHAARRSFLDDGRDQAVRREFQLVQKAHSCIRRCLRVLLPKTQQSRTGMPCAARNFFTSPTVYSPK